jgi:hypothetical protein
MDSISGGFALAAFIGGLFCARLKTAAIVGAVPALLYALLVVVGLWDMLADANLPYVLGGAHRILFGDLFARDPCLLHATRHWRAVPSPAWMSAFCLPARVRVLPIFLSTISRRVNHGPVHASQEFQGEKRQGVESAA